MRLRAQLHAVDIYSGLDEVLFDMDPCKLQARICHMATRALPPFLGEA